MKIKKRGFTLLELLIVITIISILVLLATPLLTKEIGASNDVRIKSNLKVAENAIKINELTEVFNHVDKDITEDEAREIFKECKIYNRKGLLSSEKTISLEKQKIQKISDIFIRESGIKDKGLFFIDESENVYYCKDNIENKTGNIKSAIVSPYSLWNIKMILNKVDELKLNTVNISIRVTTSDEKASDMKLDQEDLAHAIKLAKELREKDINIILEPFLWIDNSRVGETELNPDDVDLWFYKWENEILNPMMDAFESESIPVSYFTVATNFINLEYAQGYWTNLFARVKGKYNVKILYRTNWWVTAEWDESTKNDYNKKLNSPLFSDENLDAISISAYFELTQEETPSLNTIKDALRGTTVYSRNQDVFKEIKDISESNGKKVFFGELGSPRFKGYATEPWNNNYSNVSVKDAQYNYFKAYGDTFWEEEWFMGFSIFIIDDMGSDYNVNDKKAVDYLRKLK